MPDLAESYCYPVCQSCGVAGVCSRLSEVKPPPRVRRWSPNQLMLEKVTCGHVLLPWPVVVHFGKNIREVFCDECGKWVEYKLLGVVKPKKTREMEGQGVIPF